MPGDFLTDDQTSHGWPDTGYGSDLANHARQFRAKLLDDGHLLQGERTLEKLAAMQTAAEDEISFSSALCSRKICKTSACVMRRMLSAECQVPGARQAKGTPVSGPARFKEPYQRADSESGAPISLAAPSVFPNNSRVPKWAKLIIAILLLPVCIGAGTALWLVVRACGGADTTWVPILAGAACWVVIYLLLPKPMWIYVFGHELTHALWIWLFGGYVKKFRATSSGGHVVVSKTNFLIALAPYFFPLYAIIVVALFAVGHWVWNWKNYLPWFHLLVGAAYAFHVILTAHILKTRQSDISSQGYLFSAVIIFLGNILVLLIGIPLLAPKVDLMTMLGWWLESTGEVFHRLGKIF